MSIRMVILASALVLPVAAFAAPVGQGTTDKGHVLTDDKGMSLYTFDKDQPGQSMCTDACAQNWPPLMAGANDKAMGDYSIVKRPDGSMQWAYRGKPLYRWSKDTKPGDTMGDGFKDIWHLARP